MKRFLFSILLTALLTVGLQVANPETALAYAPGVTTNSDVGTSPERLFSTSDTSIDACKHAVLIAPYTAGKVCYVGPNANPQLIGGYVLSATTPTVTLPIIEDYGQGNKKYDLGDWYGDCTASSVVNALCYE